VDRAGSDRSGPHDGRAGGRYGGDATRPDSASDQTATWPAL